MRFPGYLVEGYKLFLFTLTAIIAAIAGALHDPQAGIINPAEPAPIASICLAVRVAIGGLFDRFAGRRNPDRHGADLGPDKGLLQEKQVTQ